MSASGDDTVSGQSQSKKKTKTPLQQAVPMVTVALARVLPCGRPRDLHVWLHAAGELDVGFFNSQDPELQVVIRPRNRVPSSHPSATATVALSCEHGRRPGCTSRLLL